MMGEDVSWTVANFPSGSELMESDSFSSFPSETIVESILDRPKFTITPRLVPDLHRRRATGGIPCFEEDTRSSWSIDSWRNTSSSLREAVLDEDSQNSFSSQRSSVKRRYSDDEVAAGYLSNNFPADNIFEYQWPLEKGDYFVLQEQISDYLAVKSFKRKYPTLNRRQIELDEKKFLKDRGIVSEAQCEIGLTALRSDDVLELICRDYPEKFQDFIRVLQEKEQQNISDKCLGYRAPSVDKSKMREFVRKAVNSAAEYNTHLNHERKEERRASFDLQTYTVHYPINRTVKINNEVTPVSRYPVALLPGQYQDYYKKYTCEELKYLPVNSVLFGPPQQLNTIYTQAGSEGSQSDSEESSSSEVSCSSSHCTNDGSGDSSSGSDVAKSKNATHKDVLVSATYLPKIKPNAVCKVCRGNSDSNKEGKQEELVHCSECENSGHPSCLEMTSSMVEVIKTYPWQCMHCKTCMLCMDPYDEDKMMFCDHCDRGYHTFCVGLKNIPSGRWLCRLCAQCASCGSRTPGPEGSRAQWQYHQSKVADKNKKALQIYCISCHKQRKQK